MSASDTVVGRQLEEVQGAMDRLMCVPAPRSKAAAPPPRAIVIHDSCPPSPPGSVGVSAESGANGGAAALLPRRRARLCGGTRELHHASSRRRHRLHLLIYALSHPSLSLVLYVLHNTDALILFAVVCFKLVRLKVLILVHAALTLPATLELLALAALSRRVLSGPPSAGELNFDMWGKGVCDIREKWVSGWRNQRLCSKKEWNSEMWRGVRHMGEMGVWVENEERP